MSQALDLSVTIERVRVRVRAPTDAPPPMVFVAGYLGANAGSPPHDHRVVIRELRIDVEAELDASEARQLGKQVAWDLASRLRELQEQRRSRVTGMSSTAGPIQVETLRVYLWGEVALHPPSHQITAAAMNALQDKVRNG